MTQHRRRLVALAVALLVGPFTMACDPAPRPAGRASPTSTVVPGSTVTVDLDGRPFRLHLPRSFDPGTPAPLVVLLHGFRASAAVQESYFKLTAESDRLGFLYAMPDGTENKNGARFWNATPACCDFFGSGVDDSTYLHRLIETVKRSYPVDSKRVSLIGHSNGGFMAYRMACEHADELSTIVSLAGAMTDDAAQCQPARPVSVLEIHGTADQSVNYDGERGRYPPVDGALAMWRRFDGCGEQASPSPPLDLDSGLVSADTTVTTYRTGCRDNTRVELWSIEGGGHIPAFTDRFAPAVAAFLLDRRAP